MTKKQIHPNEDLRVIRSLMEQSSKFLSLSGLSGVFAGFCALAGAGFAWYVLQEPRNPAGSSMELSLLLFADALLVLTLSLLGAFFLSLCKARKAGVTFWSPATRRAMGHLLIPLISGGLLILILYYRSQTELIAPAMLIFYGLALVNAGKFTFNEIQYLGLTEILLGLLSALFVSYSLFFWAVGFGLMHIVYGTLMYFRYDRANT